MVIGREHSKTSELGWFSSNHLIRQAAYDCVQDSVAQHRDITLMSGKKVIQTHSDTKARSWNWTMAHACAAVCWWQPTAVFPPSAARWGLLRICMILGEP